jgi:hypothetical protein
VVLECSDPGVVVVASDLLHEPDAPVLGTGSVPKPIAKIDFDIEIVEGSKMAILHLLTEFEEARSFCCNVL